MVRARDPVCGMEVNVEKAAGESRYHGRTYYFCTEACKRQFDEQPRKFAPEPE